MSRSRFLTKTIWVLSLVSLFTDVASEMLYPVMPVYLEHIGFSVLLIGILEGVAEATAGLSKGYFGQLSDHLGKRVPFVRLGYAMSAVSKPMMAVFTFPVWIFFARTIDRFGKGIRTGARDAILSDEAKVGSKGKIFGFHRAMDTLGAVLGPTCALIFLHFYPESYRTMFVLAFIPGLLAVGATFWLRESKQTIASKSKDKQIFPFFSYWKKSTPEYRKLTTGLLLFTLFNSSDVFLILKAKEAGLSDQLVIGVYIFYNLIYALTSFPIGALADKLSLKTVFLSGLLFFGLTYAGMAINTASWGFYVLFFTYGIYAAATEGVSKAWITQLSKKEDTASAIGTFAGLQSIFTMLASSFTGIIWYRFGSQTALFLSAGVAIFVFFYLLFLAKNKVETI